MGPASTAALAGLFASAFLAGSILPAQSEIVLAALLLSGEQEEEEDDGSCFT